MSPTEALLRRLPSMNSILEDDEVRRRIAAEGWSRGFARKVATALLDRLRNEILAGDLDEPQMGILLSSIADDVMQTGAAMLRPRLRRVVNGTGVVVHTNLGRSPWSPAAAARVAELTTAYLNLEYDLAGGARGGRDRPVASLLERLLPGVDVAVVNNNAAAVLLVLNTFAQGRDVVVSRGQLVEIGGSFRIPEIMEKGFCRLREVGTTNRTRIEDFRQAIGPETGLLLAVHPSNYRVVGFTQSVPLEQLVALGRETGVPVIEDLGSGNLIELGSIGAGDDPTVGQRLATGVDLVTFSGDKLLGGPQAGLIAGRPESVDRVRENPLYRALRLDKATFLALEATLIDYLAGRSEAVPTLAMLRQDSARLRARAESLAALIDAIGGVSTEVVQLESRVGGGAAPDAALPSWGIAIAASLTPDQLVSRLRGTDPAVVGRVVDDRLVLDVRTLLAGDEERIDAALQQAIDGE
ncbi:MAG TPA: L-seryl-tRNA(Sec) selenium transferase [Acidobacteriota bacterium]|nr:L-seryl-tRNA(Sec) selenium transferase [Acidobacteriota bacterium]